MILYTAKQWNIAQLQTVFKLMLTYPTIVGPNFLLPFLSLRSITLFFFFAVVGLM